MVSGSKKFAQDYAVLLFLYAVQRAVLKYLALVVLWEGTSAIKRLDFMR